MDFNGGSDDKPLDFTTFGMITNDWLVRCWTSTRLDGYKSHWNLSWINVPDDCDHMAYRQWCPFTRSCHFPSNVSSVSDFVPDVTTGRSRYTSNKMSRCGFHWGKVHPFTNQKFRFLVLQSTKQHSPTSVLNTQKRQHQSLQDTKKSSTCCWPPRSQVPSRSQCSKQVPQMTGIGWQPIAVLAIGISFCVDEDPNFTTTIINKPVVVWFFLNSKQKNDHPSQWIGLGENWNRKP